MDFCTRCFHIYSYILIFDAEFFKYLKVGGCHLKNLYSVLYSTQFLIILFDQPVSKTFETLNIICYRRSFLLRNAGKIESGKNLYKKIIDILVLANMIFDNPVYQGPIFLYSISKNLISFGCPKWTSKCSSENEINFD